MRIENDTDAAGVAEVVAAFVSGTLNDLFNYVAARIESP